MITVRALSLTFQWVYIMSAFFSFIFFCWQKSKNRCKWEVLYVSSLGGIIAFLKVYLEDDPVNAFTIAENGRKMPWLRYVGWLVTCPVLLIHLGNLTGETNFNIMRLMKMLVGLQLMVVSASTATVLDSGVRWLFYMTGWLSMLLVFSQAFDVFYEAQNIFPKKTSEGGLRVVREQADAPLRNGINAISTDFTNFLMARHFADVPSKTIWGLLGWTLRWNILRKADGKLNEQTAKALEVEIKAKVCIVDNDMTMSHYLLGKLIAMAYEPVIASNPDEMYTIIENGEADVIFMEYGVAEAGDHSLPREIFYNYRLPVVAYGYDIPVNTFFLRSKHITDVIHGLPGDEAIDAVIERWAPVPGMEEESYAYRQPINKKAAAAAAAAAPAEAPVVARTPSFTDKAAMIFGGAANPHAAADAAAAAAAAAAPPPPAPSGSRSPRGGRAMGSGRQSPRGSFNNNGGGNVSLRSASVGGFNSAPRGSTGTGQMMFNSIENSQQTRPSGGLAAAPHQQQGFATSSAQQMQQQVAPVQPQEVRVQMESHAPAAAPHGAAAPAADAAPSLQGADGSGGLHKLQSKIQDVELQLKHLRALSSTQRGAGGV